MQVFAFIGYLFFFVKNSYPNDYRLNLMDFFNQIILKQRKVCKQ